MTQDESKEQGKNTEKPHQSIANKLKNILMTEINTPNLDISNLLTNIIPRRKDTSIRTKNTDYTKLRDLLHDGNWKEADQETWKILRLAAGKDQENWLEPQSLTDFPCQDLQVLDKLWLEFSQGHFGFSVQKSIYESLGGENSFDESIWGKLGDRVGWRSGGQWLNYLELKFDLHALEGHLPVEPIKVNVGGNPAAHTKRGKLSFSIFSRLETCHKKTNS